MREALIIAWREYTQYVFSRGFLLMLALAPLALVGFGLITGFAQSTRTEKVFAVYDPSGRYLESIDSYLEERDRRRVIAAFDQYLLLNAAVPTVDETPIPEPYAPGALTTERVTAFFAGDTPEMASRRAIRDVQPFLRANAGRFEPPLPAFRRVTPADPVATASRAAFVDAVTRALIDQAPLSGAGDPPLFAALVLPDDFGLDQPEAEYWSRNYNDTSLQNRLEDALRRALQEEAATGAGLSIGEFDTIRAISPELRPFRPDRTSQSEDASLTLRDRIESGLPAVMTYFLFILIFSVGSLLLTNTIEERSNKIVETLLSSVTAGQLMLGKLIGIGAVGLTIPAVGLVGVTLGAFTVFADNTLVQTLVSALLFSPLVWIYLFYFLTGYVIFAMIYLAIGAISNSLQDAQTFLGPVTIVLVLPLGAMPLVFQEPNGLIASIMTWIPIYTPYAVMLRAAADPPLWEILGATALMLLFAIVFVTFMGRIFRRGLLNDTPPTLAGLFRLLRRDEG